MRPNTQQLQDAERLTILMYHYGFAIWQLQELENVLAIFFTMRVKSTKGMGEEAGNELLSHALKQTLGTTLKELNKAGVLETEFTNSLTDLLNDRNWLVHRARRETRGVVRNPGRAEHFLIRVNDITTRCEAMLNRIETESRAYAISQGVNQAEANTLALQIARSWEIPI